MDDNKQVSLFDHALSPLTSKHLAAATRWGKFLAIFLLVLLGIYSFTGILPAIQSIAAGSGNGAALAGDITGNLLLFALFCYPILQLFKFCRLSGKAIQDNNPALFDGAFHALKIFFKWAVVLLCISFACALLISFIN